MESHCVLEVDRLSARPPAIHSSENNDGFSAVQDENERLQNSSGHMIVSFDSAENLQAEQVDEQTLNAAVGLRECRICQEEDEERHLETPCACSGSVKFAHRKCIQRWCDEKGDTTCEICRQPYQHGYTATPRRNDSSDEWEFIDIHQLDPQDQQRFIAIAAAQRHLLEAEYNEFAAVNARGAACFRSAVLLMVMLLLLRHALSLTGFGVDEDASTCFTLFSLRVAGFLLPCYIMARALDMLRHRWQREEAAGLALLLQNRSSQSNTIYNR